MKATVITDASYIWIPEAGQGFGGWAAWVRVDGLRDAVKGAGILKPHLHLTDSNMAEVFAALNGIWLAAHHGGHNILVRSDNLMVGHLIEGTAKATRFLKVWREALDRDDMQGLTLSFKHVKGHTNDPAAASWVNRWCDEKAGHYSRKATRRYYDKSRRSHRPESQGVGSCPPATGISRSK